MNDFNPFLSKLPKLWYSRTRRKLHGRREGEKIKEERKTLGI
jgi:hypothetical protein